MSDMFKWAAEYASLGWYCVPCHAPNGDSCTCSKGRDCPSLGKHPIMVGWHTRQRMDEDELAEWFDGRQKINLGVQLGERSGIVDVEFDSEEGRRTAESFGLDKAYTPTFTSRRSTHRIFKHDDRLPKTAVIKIDGLEVRLGGGGKGGQSIMPPSIHASGASYSWVDGMSPGECEVAELPRELMIAICNAADGDGGQATKTPANSIITTKVGEGERYPALLRWANLLCIKMLDQHDPFEQQLVLTQLHAINQTQCVPPKEKHQIEFIFHEALRWAVGEKIKGNAQTEDAKLKAAIERAEGSSDKPVEQQAIKAYTVTGLEFRDEEWWPGDWVLTVVHGDPVQYNLKMPVFRAVEGDEQKIWVTVPMSAEVYRSSAKVAQAILEATHNVIIDAVPEQWALIWNGRGPRKGKPAIRGLKAKLMDVCHEEAATAENCRYAQVAGWLLDALSMTPRPADDDEEDGEPDVTGYPSWVRGRDGAWELWFSWTRVWEIVDRGRRKLETGDRKRCGDMVMAAVGQTSLPSARGKGESGRTRRFIRFSDEHLDALEKIASGEFQPAENRNHLVIHAKPS